MPRTPRLDFADARHHVMNRTAGRRRVLGTDADLGRFTALLSELPGRYGLRVHAWALMPNHFHLLVDTPRGNLSAAMAWFAGSWSRATNRARGSDGSLFRGRFRNRLVLDDAYWRHLLFYVHLNPVAAGLVDHPDRSDRTSHRAYVGLDRPPAWLHRRELEGLVGGREGYRSRLDELLSGRAQLPDDVGRDGALPTSTAAVRAARVPAAAATLSTAEALRRVEALTGETADELGRAVRGREGHPARGLLAWWLVRAAGHSRASAAAQLGTTPSAVGNAVHRVTHAADDALARWRDALLAEWRAGEALPEGADPT